MQLSLSILGVKRFIIYFFYVKWFISCSESFTCIYNQSFKKKKV